MTRIRSDNHNLGRNIMCLARPPQHGQQLQPQQERAQHVHRNRALPPLGVDPLARRDARVQHREIQPRQLIRARRKLLYALKRRLVQRPHLDDAAPARRQLNVRLGRLAFIGAAYGEDHLGGVEPHKVPRRFEAQTDVRARDDDGAAGAVVGWVGELFELGAEEVYCHHLGGFFSAGLFLLIKVSGPWLVALLLRRSSAVVSLAAVVIRVFRSMTF